MMRRLAQLAILFALIGVPLWWFATRVTTVTTAELIRGDAAAIVYATGVVEPERWAKVTPMVRARIVSTCRCEGHYIEQGTVLFRLDDSEIRARLNELHARLTFAQKELLRAEDLFNRRVGTRERYEEALADVSQFRAGVVAIESQLAHFEIKAPMAGQVLRIGEHRARQGRRRRCDLGLGQALAWVGQPRPLLIVAEVNEEDIPLVRTGQEALIAADAFPGQNLAATVSSITPKGDPVLRTYRVYLALPPDTPLFIGMTVDVNIVTAVHRDVVLAPAPSVIGGMLQVVDDAGVVEIRQVETGIVGTEHIEIVSGARAGETVISPAVDEIVSGDRIQAK